MVRGLLGTMTVNFVSVRHTMESGQVNDGDTTPNEEPTSCVELKIPGCVRIPNTFVYAVGSAFSRLIEEECGRICRCDFYSLLQTSCSCCLAQGSIPSWIIIVNEEWLLA